MKTADLKVMVVDDSSVVRHVIKELLLEAEGIASVETAPNGKLALRKLERYNADVVTLDVEMPEMDGLSTLSALMRQAPRPVIMLSAHTTDGATKTIRALELGAMDFVTKPEGRLSRDLETVGNELVDKIMAVAGSRNIARCAVTPQLRLTSHDLSDVEQLKDLVSVIALGASTGGTEVLRTLLSALPRSFPLPILIVQHMPKTFTGAFARRLDELTDIVVLEAAHHDVLVPGRALVAPGHRHMVIRGDLDAAFVELSDAPPVSGHRPSVDVLFRSVCDIFGAFACAGLLTGMGRDGAAGLSALHHAGALTIAQSRASCAVFGMPRVAIEMGAATMVEDIDGITNLLANPSRLAQVLRRNVLGRGGEHRREGGHVG